MNIYTITNYFKTCYAPFSYTLKIDDFIFRIYNIKID